MSARKLEACGYTGTSDSQYQVLPMTLSQFHCPHCNGPFQVDTSLPSLQVACPHCRQPVAVESEPPVSEPRVVEPPLVEPPLVEPPLIEPPPAEPRISGVSINRPRGHSPADLLPPGVVVASKEVASQPSEGRESNADDFRARQMVADDRASRKFIKNMIVWVCCTIVLVSILAYFLRQGGS
ncbi:MAG: hypothetical protein HYV60_17980 [Planctomycetia bacterium]|nr:hypothetical protein [Planctomycetia bacterium]